MYGRSIDKNQPFQIYWGIPIELLKKKSYHVDWKRKMNWELQIMDAVNGTKCPIRCWSSFDCVRRCCAWSSHNDPSNIRDWCCCCWFSAAAVSVLDRECWYCRWRRPLLRWRSISSNRVIPRRRSGSVVWPTDSADWKECAAYCRRRSFRIDPDPIGRRVCGDRTKGR